MTNISNMIFILKKMSCLEIEEGTYATMASKRLIFVMVSATTESAYNRKSITSINEGMRVTGWVFLWLLAFVTGGIGWRWERLMLMVVFGFIGSIYSLNKCLFTKKILENFF